MTVSSELNRKQYTGNGVTTSFATSPVVFFDSSDLDVYVVTTATGAATLLTETTDYTVSGGDGSTGTVSLAGLYGAPSASQTLVIVRNVPLTQATDFVQNDASDAEVVEDALDRLTMADQQLSARLTRSFTLADSDVSGASLTVPTPSANKLVGWNSAGTALENKTAADIDLATVTAFIETLLDDADAAAARTTLDVPSNSEAILDSIIDAKGDLIVGTAADTPTRKAAGSNRTVLRAASGESDGLEWKDPLLFAGAMTCLKGGTGTASGTSATVAADEVVLTDANGDRVRRTSTGTLTCTLNGAQGAAAANGRDQSGNFSNNTDTHLFVIWNGSALACVASQSGSPTAGPTLPNDYTHWAYAYSFRIGSTTNTVKSGCECYLRGSKVFLKEIFNFVAAHSPTVNVEGSLQSSSAAVPACALSFVVDFYVYCTNNTIGAQVYTLLRAETGKNVGQVVTMESDTAGGWMAGSGQYEVANLSNGVYFYFTNNAGTTSNYVINAYIQAYRVPNGGE